LSGTIVYPNSDWLSGASVIYPRSSVQTISGANLLTGTISGSTLFLSSTAQINGSTTIGTGAGQRLININGGGSGTNGGSAVYFKLSGATTLAFGNYSAIIGGAYDPTALVYGLSGMRFISDSINTYMFLSKTGNLGLGTTTPNQKLDISGNIVLSGALSVPLRATEQISGGYVVMASRVQSLSVRKTGLTDGTQGRDVPIGVCLSNTLSGSVCNIATNGMAQVVVTNETTNGDFLLVSDTISGAVTSSASPPVPADANHWREVGHALQSVSGGSLCWACIHFN
jgi:hypothetical protein